MAPQLPKLPNNGPRNVSVSFRLSQIATDQLKSLAEINGLSQADVIEWLLDRETKAAQSAKKGSDTAKKRAE